jgi:uncharacterized protein YdaU (DUF1376 family)
MKRTKMPLDTDAYLSDTTHLSTVEHGAYFLILMSMWRTKDGFIPADDAYLARAARLTLDKWRKMAPTIRAFLFEEGGKVSQKRTRKEINDLDAKPESQLLKSRNPSIGSKSLKNNKVDSKAGVEAENLLLLTSSPSDESKKGKKERVRGKTLPEGWTPSDGERLYGRTVLRLTDSEIDTAAEKMRRWALSNAHRAIAQKSNWNLTFRNWMDNEAERKGVENAKTGTSGGTSKGGGFASYAAKRAGIKGS